MYQANAQRAEISPSELPAAPNSMRVGGYRFLRQLGKAGQGESWLAEDEKNQQLVAIKVYDLRLASDWKTIELWKREIDVLRNISIEGVPEVIEVIEAESVLYAVQTYVNGSSLKARLEEDEWSMDFGEMLNVITPLAEILRQLQNRGVPIIHRDINPNNIIIDEKRKVWLTDFGVVAAFSQKTNASTMAGTAGYMAPEQLMGKVTPAADMYALGATILTMLTGIEPHQIKTRKLKLQYEDLLPESVPLWFSDILSDLLEPDPENRIQNADELLQLLSAPHDVKPDDRQMAQGSALKEAIVSLRVEKMHEIRTGRKPALMVILFLFLISSLAAAAMGIYNFTMDGFISMKLNFPDMLALDWITERDITRLSFPNIPAPVYFLLTAACIAWLVIGWRLTKHLMSANWQSK
ncbi:MAG: serine/threonine protein kinase [Proteobacteria bacterium]|nr:serine/threonine protein kinase [Pseudomonadota bacterium]